MKPNEEALRRALGNMLSLSAVRDAAEKVAPLWLKDADEVLISANSARRPEARLDAEGVELRRALDEMTEELQAICEKHGALGGDRRTTFIANRLDTLTAYQEMFFKPDAERRLWYISNCVARNMRVNRADLVQAFGVSIPQASADLKRWIELHPGALIYDASSKCYRVTPAPLTANDLAVMRPEKSAIARKSRWA